MHRFNDNLVHWHSNEELLRALVAENVDFVLIGGLAVAWYCESRQADDLDLLVAPTSELLTPSAGGPTYAEVAQSAEPAKLLGLPIRVPSRAMLVRTKLWSISANHEGREKHLADVELLLGAGSAGVAPK